MKHSIGGAGAPYGEGANISVKMLSVSENNGWGQAAKKLYYHDRVLDGDPFFLRLYEFSDDENPINHPN